MTAPPALDGVLETCLYVSDMERSRAFYERVFGLEPMVAQERITAFDAGPRSVLILFLRGGTLNPVPVGESFIPPHDGSGPQHFAFAIPKGSEADWRDHLAAQGVALESEIAWGQGGHSFYFRDPDGLLIELATPGLWRNY